MRYLFVVLTFMASFAFAQTTSELHTEFLRRDALKLTAKEGAVINFLKLLKFPVDTIIEIEVFDNISQDFLIKDKADNICLGSIAKEMLRCKNILGITGVVFQGDAD